MSALYTGIRFCQMGNARNRKKLSHFAYRIDKTIVLNRFDNISLATLFEESMCNNFVHRFRVLAQRDYGVAAKLAGSELAA